MKLRPQRPAAVTSLLLFPLALTNCVISEGDLENAIAEANANSKPSYGQPLTAVRGQGRATIMEDSRTGRQEGTLMACELANGGPAWATGMAD